jgi:hypothetical protein
MSPVVNKYLEIERRENTISPFALASSVGHGGGGKVSLAGVSSRDSHSPRRASLTLVYFLSSLVTLILQLVVHAGLLRCLTLDRSQIISQNLLRSLREGVPGVLNLQLGERSKIEHPAND